MMSELRADGFNTFEGTGLLSSSVSSGIVFA